MVIGTTAMTAAVALVLLAATGCRSGAGDPTPAGGLALGAVNENCPRSGRPVVADSLAEYRGYVVGFCNPGCRDDFDGGGAKRPLDEGAFDAAIALREATGDDAATSMTKTLSGLRYRVLREGTGAGAATGDRVTIHETTARIADGSLVHSTRPGGAPIPFTLGAGMVVDGVDEAVRGMRTGERRVLIVPPGLSRRTTYPDGLDPNAVLVYDVEVIGIEPGGS